MPKSFTEYWEQNKDFFAQLNVSRETAYKIWCDALDAFEVAYNNKTKGL